MMMYFASCVAKSVVSEIFGSLRYRSEGMPMHPGLAFYVSAVSGSTIFTHRNRYQDYTR